MCKDLLISVLMPVYNADKYLSEAIESILNQTHSNLELIISYDESSDGSLKIIREYEKKDKRIIISYGKKRGLIKSLNDGLIISKGEYIARMDADDISLPRRLEKQLKYMRENPEIGVCGSWVEMFGNVKKKYIWKLQENNKLLKARLLFSVPFAHPSVMINSNLIKKYDLKYNSIFETVEDYKLWLDISKYTKFANIPEVLIKYRYLKNSLSRIADKDFEKRYLATKKVFSEVLQKMNIKNSEKENILHFTVGFNDRIENTYINLNYLNIYLNKLINANRRTNFFDQKFFEEFLKRKFLIVIYFKIKNKDLSFSSAIFYKIFWQGIFNIIKKIV